MAKNKIVICCVVILFLALLSSCGQMDPDQEKGSASTKLGFLSATINWPHTPQMKVGSEEMSSFAPMPSTIKTVTMTASGGGMTPVSKDFNANHRSGDLPAIPVGNRTLTCKGKDASGTTLYLGSSPVFLQADAIAEVTVDMKFVGNLEAGKWDVSLWDQSVWGP